MTRELILETKENLFMELKPGTTWVIEKTSLKITTEGRFCKHSVPVTEITLVERPGCMVIDPHTTYFTKYTEPTQSAPTKRKGGKR